jgi:iron complex transport system substrate-binding protein
VAVIAQTAETRTVSHVGGMTVIPRRPQRVAVLGWNDEVVALGIHPVAAGGDGWRGFAPHVQAGMAEARLIDSSGGGPDLEALAAAKPDVIIATALIATSAAQLNRIAPTVLLEPAQQEWRQRFRDVALVLDRTAEANARLAQLETRITRTRAELQARLGHETVALVRVFAREYRLYGRSYSGPLLYDDLGLAMPSLVRSTVGQHDVVRLSIEGLAQLDADHLLLMTEEHIPVSFQVRERLTAHPLWRAMPAVRAGRVHLVPDLMMRGGIIGRELMLDRLLQELAP